MLHRRVICQPYIFELIRCRQLTFCCFLCEINILAPTRLSEIHILIYFDLKSRFFNFITCRAKLLNADWLRQRAFFLKVPLRRNFSNSLFLHFLNL